MNVHRSLLRATVLAALLAAPALHADPLHPLAGNAYWHHESNFIFPARLAEFTRVGAPQELDGSTTVVAYYARGDGDARQVVTIDLFPIAAGEAPTAGGNVVRSLEHAGWRVVVRAARTDVAATAPVDALVRALAIDRLGAIDTRCPNAGCGS